MQAYQIEPLPLRAPRVRRQARLSPLDLVEPLLLAIVGVLALAPTRFPAKTILIGLAVLLVPYLLRWLFYGAPSRSTLADLPLALLFFVVAPLSLWVTPYFWETTWAEWVRMMWGGAVCMAVINWARPLPPPPAPSAAARYRLPGRLWLLTFAYLALGVVLGLVGLVNMDIVNKLPLIDQVARQFQQMQGTELALVDSFNPNRVAALLVLYAPLPLAFLLASGRTRPPQRGQQSAQDSAPRQPRRVLTRLLMMGLSGGWWLLRKSCWFALWCFFGGGLLLTQSRAGLVAAAVATLVVLALTWRQPAGWLRLVGGLFLLLFLLGMGYSALTIQVDNGFLTTFFQEAATTIDSAAGKTINTDSLSGRLLIWQRALHGIADQPLTGMGLAAFDRLAQEPYPLAGYVPGDIHHAHNLFLQTALDFGLPGLLLWLMIVVLAAASLVALYRSAPPAGQLSVWTVAIIGCFVAFVLYNLLDALTLGARPAVALWFLLGLALSARGLIIPPGSATAQ